MQNRILVVGAGFSGAVIARTLAEDGYSVDVIDQRSHIAGNAYDYTNEHGIRIHKYGAHIFHTDNENIVKWLGQYTEWVEYKHKVKALLKDGTYVTFPPNCETIDIVGKENLIDVFYKPYTEKMWDTKFENIDQKIIKRTVHLDKTDDLFFRDAMQLLPKAGYSELFARMLAHKNINVVLNQPFEKALERDYEHVFNSMCIDEYYDYCYGELPYRSIKFTHMDVPAPKIFPVSVVNFTHTGPATRAIEWKNFPEHGDNDAVTTITYETPCWPSENSNERYYPVNDSLGKNRDLYKKYSMISNSKITFIGRCGEYVYIDMHQAVSSGMAKARRFIELRL